MLKAVTVFDEEVFKPGIPIKVHFPGMPTYDFFAIVEDCDLGHLHLVTILPKGCNAYPNTKDRINWYHVDDDKKTLIIKIEKVLDKSVEILLLEQAFNILGVSLI